MASQSQPCPPGVAALGVSLKQLKAYGLSTGPTLFDVVPSGLVEKAFALDEAGRLGYMSAFNAHKAAIKVRLCGARASRVLFGAAPTSSNIARPTPLRLRRTPDPICSLCLTPTASMGRTSSSA